MLVFVSIIRNHCCGRLKLSSLVLLFKLCIISTLWLSHEHILQIPQWVSVFPSLVHAATRPPISQPIFDVCQMCSNRSAGCNDRLLKRDLIAHQQANNKPHLHSTLQLSSFSESGFSLCVLALTIYGSKFYWSLIGCGGDKAQVDALPCLGFDSPSFSCFLWSKKKKPVTCLDMKTTQLED